MTGSQIRTSALAKRNQSDQVSLLLRLSFRLFFLTWYIAQKVQLFFRKIAHTILTICHLWSASIFCAFPPSCSWLHCCCCIKTIPCSLVILLFYRIINGNRIWSIKNCGWQPSLPWVNKSKVRKKSYCWNSILHVAIPQVILELCQWSKVV